MPSGRRDRIAETVLGLERAADLSVLLDLLAEEIMPALGSQDG